MAIIGNFRRDGDGFTGHIATLSLNVAVQFTKAERNGHDRAPDYRIFAESGFELGAAWTKRARDTGRTYVSCKLDSPEFAAPIFASLMMMDTEDRFDLVWSRPTN
jgi:uncharacterized protein (DUF736 family)